MKVAFENKSGKKLSGRLELPVNQHPHSFALFAHCFTCSKDLNAVVNISRALNQSGIGVLRFDFAGLGQSEGDFENTNFSSNIEDIVAAADFLKQHYSAPAMLIGHSLGGSAVLASSEVIDSAKVLVTIGSPFDPAHVEHVLKDVKTEIEEEGVAEVTIAGRAFRVKKQFLQDIREQNLKRIIEQSRKALLIMHSPQDEIVEIANAKKIYEAAFHPKSFISLDKADHLLSDKADSQYVGECIGTWSKRYLSLPEKENFQAFKEVAVRLGKKGFTTEIMVRHHQITADEPEDIGGNDFGPSPYELVAAGLGACTAMTLQMYARRKRIDLKEVVVHLQHYKDYAHDMADTEASQSKIDHFERWIELKGDLEEAQRKRLMEIADKCPVHRTLTGPIEIISHQGEPPIPSSD